jgi:tetratricopeptide (TPR) repeat protein
MKSVALFRTEGELYGLADILSDLGGLIDNEDYERARAYLDESLALNRAVGNWTELAWQMLQSGRLAMRHRDYGRARELLGEAMELQRQLSIHAFGDTLGELGKLALLEGDLVKAQSYYEEAREMATTSGRPIAGHWTLAHLGYVSLRQGKLLTACDQWMECLKYFRAQNVLIGIVYCVEGFASLLVSVNQWSPATSLFAWADAQREVLNNERPTFEQDFVDADWNVIHANLDEPQISAAYKAGNVISVDQVVQYALTVVSNAV